VKPFRYERPGSSAEATALADREPEAAYLGGGTNLVDLMRLEVASPPVLVDVHDLGLDEVQDTAEGGLLIGATATNTALAADARVRERYPVLHQALLNGASPQLRNRATAGGNLLQRTRCAYFQDVTKPCNKRDPGSGCPAVDGEHRNLAILGWSPACVATHPSDMAVAMVLLDAVVHLEHRDSHRSVAVEELYADPDDDPSRDTVLQPGELITGIELPPVGPMRSIYAKARERASFSFALVSVAAALVDDPDDGPTVRLALGSVAHKPWRARRAEDALRGRPLDREQAERAADAELEAARPLRDNAYKVTMAHNMIVRSLLDLREVR
jgi:xanthine dehydrogenase YagS FAD-binding subunit